MKYTYKCPTHDKFEVDEPMLDPHIIANCPNCGKICTRVWEPTPHTWSPYDNPNHPERRGVEG